MRARPDRALIRWVKALLASAVGCAIGGGLVCVGQWRVRVEHAQAQYVSTTGKILELGTEVSVDVDEYGREERKYYTPTASYSYLVQGKPCHGRQIAYDMTTFRHATPAAATAALPWRVGQPTTVYYNPAVPEEVVLVKPEPTAGTGAGGWWPPHPLTSLGVLIAVLWTIAAVYLNVWCLPVPERD